MTTEQEALRDRIADAVDSLRTRRGGGGAANRIMSRIPGLRVVGDDEVVVPRSSIREETLCRYVLNPGVRPEFPTHECGRIGRSGACPRYDHNLGCPANPSTHQVERVGVISPWPPEDAS